MRKLLNLIIPFMLLSCSGENTPFIMDWGEDFTAEYNLLTPDLDPDNFAPTHKYIEIEIQGRLYPFILDTGDRYGTLKFSSETIKQLDHTLLDDRRRSKSLYGKNNETLCLVPGIKIGNQEIDILTCEISDDSWFWPWDTAHEDMGMIGWGLLRDLNFSLDYSEDELVFYDHGTIPEHFLDWDSIAYAEKENMISVKGYLAGSNRQETLLIDTGAGSYLFDSKADPFLDVLFSRSFMRNRDSKDPKANFITRDFISDDFTMESLRFGKMPVPFFLSFEYDGFLGWGYFWNHEVYFDNENQLMYIRKDSE